MSIHRYPDQLIAGQEAGNNAPSRAPCRPIQRWGDVNTRRREDEAMTLPDARPNHWTAAYVRSMGGGVTVTTQRWGDQSPAERIQNDTECELFSSIGPYGLRKLSQLVLEKIVFLWMYPYEGQKQKCSPRSNWTAQCWGTPL